MDQFSAHLDRGWDLVQRGDAYGAEHSARRALELNAESPEAYNLLGYAAALRGEFEDAMEHYEHAIALDDTYLEAILNAAELCIYPMADFEAADRYCEEALSLAESDEERVDALLLKFDALIGQGDSNGAKAVCARLPREGFENPAHAFLVARALFEVGDVSAASSLIGEAVRLNPTSPEAHYYQALIFDEQNNTDAALAAFLKSRELDMLTPPPPWSMTVEALRDVVLKVLTTLPEPLRGILSPEQVFISDMPGVEVIVDGIDPRALLLLEPLAAADDAANDDAANDDAANDAPPDPASDGAPPSSATPRVEAARLFVYQRNLERVAGTAEALAQELQGLLERELEAFAASGGVIERAAPTAAQRS
jgi:Flp pilus assembly protein TadD